MSQLTPFWLGHYLGLPYHENGRDRSGLDDWGLYRLISAEQFNIALPSGTSAPREARLKTVLGSFVEIYGPPCIGDAIVIGELKSPLVGMYIGGMRMLTNASNTKHRSSFTYGYGNMLPHVKVFRYKGFHDSHTEY